MNDSAEPQIISHYQVDSLLGVGAMGSVYLGIDRRDGTLVAIKLIARFLADDPEFRKRFEREAHVAALLRSPYTVRVADYGVEEGRVFMAMEYVDGPSVNEVLADGPLEPARATRITLQVARALEEAEARGIVHRDVKPDNILLGPEETAKLADFGVARQDTSMLTRTGGFYGTASYAAPEQFEGKADNRSDIYALGATLYHLLLGRPPVGGDLESARSRILAGDIAFADLATWPELRSIVETAMATDPDQRYQSARELAGALETALVQYGGSSAMATVAGAPVTDAPWRAEEETLRLALKGPTTNLPFGRRYAALKYELAVTNQGHDEAKVHLKAADRVNACRFSMPEVVSVPAGATSHVSFKVRPAKRRFRGPDLTRIFTVAGRSGGGGGTSSGGGGGGGGDDRGGDDGGPPVTTSGRFEDSSFGWLPLGMSGLALLVALFALFVATVGTGASDGDDARPLKIGVLMPTSGRFDHGLGESTEGYGPAYMNAARMAVAEINADGGVLGEPVTLATGDTANDMDVAIQEARRLVNDEQVTAIIGDFDMTNTLEVANTVTNPAGIIHLAPIAVFDDATMGAQGQPIENDPPFLFKTLTRPEALGLAAATAVANAGYTSACSIHSPEVGPLFEEAMVNAGTTIEWTQVQHETVIPEPGSETPTASEQAAAEVEACGDAPALVLNVFPDPELVAEEAEPGPARSSILEAALAHNFETIFVTAPVFSDIVFLGGSSSTVLDAIDAERLANVRVLSLTGAGERQGGQFDQYYKDRFGEAPAKLTDGLPDPPDLRTVYDSVYLLALAAESAGSVDPAAIRDALPDVANAPGTKVRPGRISLDVSEPSEFATAISLLSKGEEIEYEGASGPVEFNADRDNVHGFATISTFNAAKELVSGETFLVDLSSFSAAAPTGSDFSSSTFAAPLSLTLAPGFVVVAETETDLALERIGSDLGGDAYLSIMQPITVIDSTVEPPAEAPPDDLVNWLVNNSRIKVLGDPMDVTVGGYPGKQIDVTTEIDPTTGEPAFVVLFTLGPETRFALFPGEQVRFTVLDVAGEQVVIGGGPIAPIGGDGMLTQADFEAVIPALQEMVDSIQFGSPR